MSLSYKEQYDNYDKSEYKVKIHETYMQKMRQEEKQRKEFPSKNSPKILGLDLKSKLKIGKVNIVNPKNLRNEFFCSICDVLKHDSSSYQSHMTSKGHLKNIGKDLTVKKSTLSQVQDRMNAGSKQKKNPGAITKKSTVTAKKSRAMKPKKLEENEPINAEQEEMIRQMGFYSFHC